MSAFMLDAAVWASPVTRLLWLPGAIVLAAALLGMVADMTGRTRPGLAVIAAGLGAAVTLTLGNALAGVASPDEAFSVVFGLIVGGGSFAGIASVVYGVALLSLSTGLHSVTEAKRVPVAALVAFGAVACQVFMGSGDVLVLFLGLEIVALVGYALVSSAGTRRADEAAMRYFVQGAVATGLFAYGIAVIVGSHGGLTFSSDLYTKVAADPLMAGMLPFTLVLGALAFKAGAFPFHSWAPDAYETAPAGVATFLAAGPKLAAITALLVLYGRSFWAQEAFTDAHALIGIIAAASIIFGNLGALKQSDVGRMLGYSGIAQVGYALVGVGAGLSSVPLLAASYAIAVAVAFACVETYRRMNPAWDGSVAGLAGAGSVAPGLAFAMTVAMLSLTGIPLTAGFVGKFFVFFNAVQSGLEWLVLIGVLGSVVSFAYYGRVIRALYLDEAGEPVPVEPIPGEPVPVEPVPTQEADEPVEAPMHARTWPAIAAAVLLLAIGTMPLALGFEGLLRYFGV
ncbi:MAG: NADH-quinone oxidoreductase subunit N [Coriobacteriia bacterium]